MNVLLVGSGAREHAIALALHRSQEINFIFCYGMHLNPGIKQLTHHYVIGDLNDIQTIIEYALKSKIDLAIIGPEAPLEKGLADELWAKSIPTIGPKKQLAQIETSKAFARDLMLKYNIKGLPRYKIFNQMVGVKDFLFELGNENYVVKANGLMGGKGVKVASEHLHSFDQALQFCESILKSKQQFVIEEKLIGQEFSLMGFSDGEKIIPMPLVQDHKRAFLNDKGPNTGGMGSYSDVNHSLPFLQENDLKEAQAINQSVIEALLSEFKQPYIGILYGGFIATKKGVKVIEFNARFGDPEALNVLSILESDFLGICKALIAGNISQDNVKFSNRATVCKYAVPEGYPDSPLKDIVIDIGAVKNKTNLYLASVHAKDGKIYATGSRAAAYVGVADSIALAEKISEKEIRSIRGPLFHRHDIGTHKLIKDRIDEMRRLRDSC